MSNVTLSKAAQLWAERIAQCQQSNLSAPKFVAVDTRQQSFELLVQNTAHIPKDKLTLINAPVTKQTGRYDHSLGSIADPCGFGDRRS